MANQDAIKGLKTGEDGVIRCWWCGDDDEYMRYHDEEWGKIVTDDFTLFEKICLEGFQSGLSWLTILRKRDNFRAAFDQFDYNKVALYDEKMIERLLQNEGIIRHRGKIEATVNNAQRAIEMAEEFGSLSEYFWRYKPDGHKLPSRSKDIPGKTEDSVRMSKDLKKRGWKFVGPTTAYAFMQSMGIVNDHIEGCHAA
tara:strand:- start:6816 stop:7406 length:591 start_codon:yes stop_codon:yes gene_type:complete